MVRPVDWDTDGDGMPNAWEQQHGLPVDSANNNGDFDADGYTDLEEYLNDVAAWPAPVPLVFAGSTNARYAEITNWQIPWQPSCYDVAVLTNGSMTVDAVGQHAGQLQLAPANLDNATLNVTNGWLRVADAIQVGISGTAYVLHTGGRVIAESVDVGGTGASEYALEGAAVLDTRQLTKSNTAAIFRFTGGTLQAEVVGFDLVNDGGTLSPGVHDLADLTSGNGSGATHIAGDLTMEAGAILIELQGAGATAFDAITVDGVAQLNGGAFVVSTIDGFTPLPSQSFKILDYGLHIGTLDIINDTGLAGLLITGDYQATSLTLQLSALPGDANLDGFVDVSDFNVWNANKFTTDVSWLNGDFNDDGFVDVSDFNIWNANKFTSLPDLDLVPEPSAGLIAWIVLLFVSAKKRGQVQLLAMWAYSVRRRADRALSIGLSETPPRS